MADCTKTVEFIRGWGRMCDGAVCHNCGIGQAQPETLGCRRYVKTYPEDAIAIVQKWSDEHPVMTWIGKLRGLLPDISPELLKNLCPDRFFGSIAPGVLSGCRANAKINDDCNACWNDEYKEVKK